MSASHAINHVTVRHSPTKEIHAYQHPYGGIARDAWVSKEGFARFFELPIFVVEDMPVNMKVIDKTEDNVEMLGYILEYNDVKYYRITVVDYRVAGFRVK